jgi:small multidrug resistance family-3 protein
LFPAFDLLTMMAIIKSLLIFILAGLFEIGGGYLVWQWLKEGKPLWYGLLGGVILALYGVVATWQTANFGRVYATYGGIFIALALLWAWKVDGFKPDRYDIIGAGTALIGACIIIYMPRNA